ncbi:MAG: segregation/condensation protein A [Actinomycetota bacterium]|nr:segregation/condensation protein A [Actinomycetota bacterium]
MPYEVSTPVFEGPLDLLLNLVVEEQVDLYEVSISTIVDAYLSHLEGLHHVDLETATEFLLMAAVLVELKVRRLLPAPATVDVDEEIELCSKRDLLLARLLECKTYSQAAQALRRLAVGAERSRPRVAGMEDRFAGLMPDALGGVTAEQLRSAMERALTPRPVPRVGLEHVTPVRASVRDAVAQLSEELPRLGEASFRRLTDGVVERLVIIVRFLAVLELYKEGLVELDQGRTFGELRVRWLGEGGSRLVPDSMMESVGEYQG